MGTWECFYWMLLSCEGSLHLHLMDIFKLQKKTELGSVVSSKSVGGLERV